LVFDAHSIGVVLLDALERRSAEAIVAKFGKGTIKARLSSVPRAELIGPITGWFFESEEVAYQVVKDMDRACQKERHIVASIPEAQAPERVGSYRAIALKRERAKFVWALARDERAVVRGLANNIIREFFQEVADQERAKETLDGDGHGLGEDVEVARRIQAQAEQLVEATSRVSALESKLSRFEAERARLMAEIGAKQRGQSEASEAKEDLAQQLRGLKERLEDLEIKEREAEDAKAREIEARAVAADLQQKVRRLEKLAGAADSLTQLQQELEDGHRRADELNRQIQRLEQGHRREREELDRERQRMRRDLDQTREELRRARERIIALESGDVDASRAPVSRRVLLVDQANLAATARDAHGRKVDFGRVRDALLDGREIDRAVAFVVDNGGAAFDGFLDVLRRNGYELRVKKPKRFEDGRSKADWDMDIAIEAVTESERSSEIILATGDGDFAALVRFLKRRGLRVDVAAFPAGLASELENVADRVFRLGEDVLE
jgi:uncharacterized LabA/DUF88 family protein